MSLQHFFDVPNKPIVRGKKLARFTTNGTIVLPAGVILEQIYFRNRTTNAVTGGIRIGTTAAGTQIVTAQAIAANAITWVFPSIPNYQALAQTLYVEAVTAWNSADVDVLVEYTEVTTRTQPNQNNAQSG